MTDLIECPFCGGEAALWANYSTKSKSYFVFVRCGICGAQTRPSRSYKDPEDEGWNSTACDAAARLWNHRTK